MEFIRLCIWEDLLDFKKLRLQEFLKFIQDFHIEGFDCILLSDDIDVYCGFLNRIDSRALSCSQSILKLQDIVYILHTIFP